MSEEASGSRPKKDGSTPDAEPNHSMEVDTNWDQSRLKAASSIYEQALPTLEKFRLVVEAWGGIGIAKGGASSIPRFAKAGEIAQRKSLSSLGPDKSAAAFRTYSSDASVATFEKRRKLPAVVESVSKTSARKLAKLNHSKGGARDVNIRLVNGSDDESKSEDDIDHSAPRKRLKKDTAEPQASPPKQSNLKLSEALKESWREISQNPEVVSGKTPEVLRKYLNQIAEIDTEGLAEMLERFAVYGPLGLGMIETPKGYPTPMQVTFEEIEESVVRFQETMNVLHGTRNPQEGQDVRFGFEPEELVKKGAIDLPDWIPPKQSSCSLDNEVLSLFRKDNFDSNCHDVYGVLLPSLRLASLLMIHPIVSQYWHTLCFGQRDVDTSVPGAEDGRPARRIRKPYHWTAKGEERIKQMINQLSDMIKFTFTAKMQGEKRYAEHAVLQASWPLRPANDSKITFLEDTYTVAKKISDMGPHADPAQVLRFNFFFAIVLVHEIAHAFEARHKLLGDGKKQDDSRTDNEVYYGDHAWIEAGRAWEISVFRGCFLPINRRLDAVNGLCIFDYPGHGLVNHWSVPMDYIWYIQQKATWHRNDLSEKNFHVPRTGAVGVGEYVTPALYIAKDDEQFHHLREDVENLDDDVLEKVGDE